MVRTLIIDDDKDKTSRIVATLRAVDGMDSSAITSVSSVFEAKAELRAVRFDLMVLDIALPVTKDGAVEPLAGLQLLQDLMRRPDKFHVPASIVGITAYEDVYEQALSEFNSEVITLLRYDRSKTDWAHAVAARARHLLIALRPSESPSVERDHYQVDLAVVCALHSPELISVLQLPWGFAQETVPGDHSLYWRGAFLSADRGHRTVIATLAARAGMTSTSAAAWKAILRFRPRVLAMTGITAGVEGRVNIGDIVAADPCWDWGSGKWILRKGKRAFLPAPHQLPLDVEIREQLKLLAQDAASLGDIRNAWKGDVPIQDLRLHIGPMATGAAVLADGKTLDAVLEQHRQLLAVEMEAYALYAASSEAPRPRPRPVVLKAVVDFGDQAKNDRQQDYGAYTSAAILRRWAERYL